MARSDRRGSAGSGESAPPTGRPVWAPFPVQDWTSYQATPSWQDYQTWSYPGSNLQLDPVGRPGPRGGALPVVVLALTLVLLAAGLLVAEGSVVRSAAPAHAVWLPTDGLASPVRMTGLRSGTATIENGIAAWPEVAQSLGIALGETMLDRSTGRSGRLWRQTVNPTAVDQPQLVSVYSLHDGIRLELDVTAAGAGTQAQAYAPGLPVLPDGVAAGSRWQAEGTWADWYDSTPRPYTAELSATADGDCLVVRADVRTQRSAGATTETQTWRFCRGAGAVERTRTAGVGFSPDALTVTPGTNQAGVPTGPAPPTGAPTPVQVRALGPRGPDLLGGTPRTSVPPFAVSPTQVVWTNQSMHDLLLVETSTTAGRLALVQQRRLHPGGLVLTATAAQGTVLATTSNRRLTAWSADGTRLWSVDTGEVVDRRPVAVDPTTVLTATVTGVVTAWDLATGAVRWTVATGRAVTVDPAAGSGTAAGVVVVADAQGGVTGYATATGAIRWTVSGDPAEQLAVITDRVVVVTGGLAYGYRVTDGAPVWTARAGGVTWAVASDGADGIWMTGPSSSTLLDPVTGQRRWRTGSTCDRTTITPSWVVCWTEDRGAVVDRVDGATVGTLALPASRGEQSLVVVQGRLWVFDAVTWTASVWTVTG